MTEEWWDKLNELPFMSCKWFVCLTFYRETRTYHSLVEGEVEASSSRKKEEKARNLF